MSIYSQRITLDVSKQPIALVLRFAQNDISAPKLIVDVTDHGEPLDVGGAVAALEILMRSGTAYSIAGTASGSTASFDINGIAAGVTDFAYVSLDFGDSKLSTQRFTAEIWEGDTQQ